MWNDGKSLVLSKICVILFMALLVAAIIFAPRFFDESIGITPTVLQSGYFRITVYVGAAPAAAVLALLYVLLSRIGNGEVFITRNTDCLRYISWCCFVGAIIGLVSTVYWLPWCAIGVAAAFMGLIVRVVKNVFAKAVSLQDDADLTV